MSATDYGTAHLYGISGTIANATVTAFKMDDEMANVGQVEDEVGRVIERRYDDLTKTGSITIKIRTAYTIPAVASVLVYETIKYEITKIVRTQENKGFRTVELSIKTSEGVTLT